MESSYMFGGWNLRRHSSGTLPVYVLGQDSIARMP